MLYVSRIKEAVPSLTDKQAHGVVGHMRCEYSTLDHLSPAKFNAEIGLALACEQAQAGYLDMLADSYGYRG